jgi:hypothetical protein
VSAPMRNGESASFEEKVGLAAAVEPLISGF